MQEGIYDEFLAGFTKVAQALTDALGDPFDDNVEDGPLISESQFDVRRNSSSWQYSLINRAIYSVLWSISTLERRKAPLFTWAEVASGMKDTLSSLPFSRIARRT